jgi:LysM repeat protein
MTRLVFVTLLVVFSLLPIHPVGAQGITYTVQPHDTLFQIARKYNVTVDAIQKTNGFTGTFIYVGQVLTIPLSGDTATRSPSAPSGGSTYIVKRGDTLSRIARAYNTTIPEIIKANKLTSTTVYAGKVLFIPDPKGQAVTSLPAATPNHLNNPTLDDFWDGRAIWKLDELNVGLPLGESDTLAGPDGQLWSYLHASFPSANIRDQWGAPVEFPGCVTLWKSANRGRWFYLTSPTCLISCERKPCTPARDQINQQQYPRVAVTADGLYVMVYEWGGAAFVRQSRDGVNWGKAAQVPGTGIWPSRIKSCDSVKTIKVHPFVDASAFDFNCLSGAPPGIYIEGLRLFVFVGMGQNPGHMACYIGNVNSGASGMRECQANPLFTGALEYGPGTRQDATTNVFFDYRTISSADVLRVGDRFYMVYEGVRGPHYKGSGDTQYGLGLARSVTQSLDGQWEKYNQNPIIVDMPGNVGVGHADLIVIDGMLYLYTATSEKTRGRYVLTWK